VPAVRSVEIVPNPPDRPAWGGATKVERWAIPVDETRRMRGNWSCARYLDAGVESGPRARVVDVLGRVRGRVRLRNADLGGGRRPANRVGP
jgi:hypothetical protein